MIGEWLSDYQLTKFRRNPLNKKTKFVATDYGNIHDTQIISLNGYSG